MRNRFEFGRPTLTRLTTVRRTILNSRRRNAESYIGRAACRLQPTGAGPELHCAASCSPRSRPPTRRPVGLSVCGHPEGPLTTNSSIVLLSPIQLARLEESGAATLVFSNSSLLTDQQLNSFILSSHINSNIITIMSYQVCRNTSVSRAQAIIAPAERWLSGLVVVNAPI